MSRQMRFHDYYSSSTLLLLSTLDVTNSQIYTHIKLIYRLAVLLPP